MTVRGDNACDEFGVLTVMGWLFVVTVCGNCGVEYVCELLCVEYVCGDCVWWLFVVIVV